MNEMKRTDLSFKPNARIYSHVINGILHSKREYSRQVSSALNDVKGELDAFVSKLKSSNNADMVKHEYYHLMVIYARLLQVEKAADLFREFETRFGSDVLVFNGLLKAYVQCHKINELKAIFNERLLHDKPMDTISYNIAIELFCKSNLIAEALGLFEQMKSRNIPTDEATYAVLIDGLGFANKFAKAVQIYLESKSTVGVSVNIASSLIEAAARCKEFVAGFQILDLTTLPKLDYKFVRVFFQCIYKNLDPGTRPTTFFNWQNKVAKSELARPLTAVHEQQFRQFWNDCKLLYAGTNSQL
jgi:pentatricopeptide repeat protein